MLYSDKLHSWLQEKKIYLKYSTYTNYCNVIHNHILPSLGSYQIEELNNDILQEMILQKLESGCDYKSLSELSGHSNVSITMNIYVHPQMELKRKCVELLCDYYK